MYNVSENRIDINKDGIPENFNVRDFIFTKKTITYDRKTIQLSNVTKIEKYSFSETWKPIYTISDELRTKAYIGALISLLLAYITSNIEMIYSLSVLALLISIAIIAYSYHERNKKKAFDKNYFGLIIETSSGKSENLLTDSYNFINQLFNEITRAMNDEGASKIVANFHSHEIKYEQNSHIEKIVAGDNYEDISDAIILNRSTVSDEKLELGELLRNMENH